MDNNELGNLRGEVAVLRELVRMLIEEIPATPQLSGSIRGALDRARASTSEGSPDRVSVDRAINSMQPWSWMRVR